jgi:hypothetical protein
MAPANFELLINFVGPKIVKSDIRCRAAIPIQDRLAVTLQFLVTGDSYSSLQNLLEISKQIVTKVCQATVEALKENIQVRNCVSVHRKLFCTSNLWLRSTEKNR